MTSGITIIMYHYVRELARSRFPSIKGIDVQKFDNQIKALMSRYTIIGFEEINEYRNGKGRMPKDPCILTFDDGFADHYRYAFPALLENGVKGVFFPSRSPVEDGKVLDVHKIHHILASIDDPGELLREVYDICDDEESLPKSTELRAYFDRFENRSRFDIKEISFLKSILQKGLRREERSMIIDKLFRCYVTIDEKALAEELYMSMPQMRAMRRNGMEFGGHGDLHDWMEEMCPEDQVREVTGSIKMLGEIYGVPPMNWVMSYPYSSHNDVTIEILREHGCSCAVTTVPKLASLDNLYEMGRYDTNDVGSIMGSTNSSQ